MTPRAAAGQQNVLLAIVGWREVGAGNRWTGRDGVMGSSSQGSQRTDDWKANGNTDMSRTLLGGASWGGQLLSLLRLLEQSQSPLAKTRADSEFGILLGIR